MISSMIDSVRCSLVFPDRRQKGRFPVRDDDDQVVALISASWTGTSFAATDGDGQPLCAGATNWLGLSGRWQATGADGSPLLAVNKSFWRSSAEVTLQRGGSFVVRGSAWRRDFTVVDAFGETVLAAVPRTSALSFRPHDFAVQQVRPALRLPEIVALVQTWRMVRKSEDAAAAGGGAAMAGG